MDYNINRTAKEGNTIKKWVIIDDCTNKSGAIWERILNVNTAEEAEAEARLEWDRLSESDKKKRDAFYVGLCEIIPEIEEGEAYYTDTMTKVIDIMG